MKKFWAAIPACGKEKRIGPKIFFSIEKLLLRCVRRILRLKLYRLNDLLKERMMLWLVKNFGYVEIDPKTILDELGI